MPIQNNSGVWTVNGDPFYPQPELQPLKRKLPPHYLLPHLTDKTATAVYAHEDGVFKYRGKIRKVTSYSFTDEDDKTHHCGPGWLAVLKGIEEPDHFEPGCAGGAKDTAISRCLTGGKE